MSKEPLMNAKTRSSRRAEMIELLSKDGDKEVWMDFERDGVRIKRVAEVLAATKIGLDIQEVAKELADLLGYLAEWLREHVQKVEKAILTVGDGGLLLLIVRNQIRFDNEFEDEVVELDWGIANNDCFQSLPLSAIPLPKCSDDDAMSFADPGFRMVHNRAE